MLATNATDEELVRRSEFAQRVCETQPEYEDFVLSNIYVWDVPRLIARIRELETLVGVPAVDERRE